MNRYDLLTTNDVAEIFAVDRNTVSRWVREGNLKAIRTPGGRNFRFHRADIDRFIATSTSPETAAS